MKKRIILCSCLLNISKYKLEAGIRILTIKHTKATSGKICSIFCAFTIVEATHLFFLSLRFVFCDTEN